MKPKTSVAALMAALALCSAAALPSRIVLGGKAVVMVADAAYLFPQASERVIAIAGADQGLGVFLASIDPRFASKPSLDRAAGAEAYAAQKPDLVVLKSSMKKSLGPSLDALGIEQLYLSLETPEDYLAEILLLGEAFGDRARAKALVDFYAKAMDGVAAKVGSIPVAERKRVLVLQAGAAGSYEVPPISWMQTIMAERAGGVPVWKGANPGSGWAKVGIEQIAAWDPQAIFVVSYREPSSALAASLAAEPALAGLSAAKAKRIFGFPQDFYSWDQPDARWILGLEWMAKALYPERFASLSMRAEAESFFAFCYGMDKARFDAVVRPRLSGDYGD
jgi:iron complex transport system substrate-binding protein